MQVPSPTRRKAVSYLRFSSSEQAKGASLKRQLEASEAYAIKHNLDLDTSLRDLGRSAFKGDHLKGHLGAFLHEVSQGSVPQGSVLIVESLDRLSRERVMDALQQFISLLNAGIEIVTLMDGRSYTAASVNANVGELIVSLTVMSRAHEESATKSQRIKDVWQRRRADAAQRPMTGRRPAWLDWQAGHFVVNTAKAEVVQWIFAQTALHGRGLYSLARELNSKNTATLSEQGATEGWTSNRVWTILMSRSVLGEFQPKQRTADGRREAVGSVIADYYPPVITHELWAQAHATRNLNVATGGRTNAQPNMLVGRMFCAECGGVMRIHTARSRVNSYMCDAAYRRLKTCTAKGFHSVRWIEQGVVAGALMFSSLPAVHEGEGRESELRQQCSSITAVIDRLSRQQANLISAMADDPIAAVVEVVRELSSKVDLAKAQLADAQNQLATVASEPTIGEQIATMQALADDCWVDDFATRQQARTQMSVVLRKLVGKVEVSRQRVARVTAHEGRTQFEVHKGLVSNFRYKVADQWWQLHDDGHMTVI